MSSEIKNLDILKIIKEVKECDFKAFKIKYGDLEIEIKGVESDMYKEPVLPTATLEQEEVMLQQEEKSFNERLREKDETFLEEIDYIDGLAGELIRANIIKEGTAGEYEYVE